MGNVGSSRFRARSKRETRSGYLLFYCFSFDHSFRKPHSFVEKPILNSRLMLHMCRPGRSVMVVYQRDKTATVQLCSVGVCLSFSIERRWQKGKWRTPEVYLSRVNLMSVFLFSARGKMPFFFFFFDLMSLAGQKEIPLPLLPLLPLSFFFLLVLQGSAMSCMHR